MPTSRQIAFLSTSIAAGLVAAIIALSLQPDKTAEVMQSAPPPTVISSGPASYADAVKKAAPSVVNIYTTKVTIEQSNSPFNDPLFQHFFGDRFSSKPKKRLQTNLGSGVIISDSGFILTNHHVVANADSIRVVLHNGRTLEATVAGSDPDTDLAVLKTDVDDLQVITIGSSGNLQVGDVVLAIGNPFGVGQTVTMGIVSATGRDQLGINTFENFIQTDAAINPGNSGGALINAYGQLVGINTAIFSESGGSQGIGFAIPVNLARGVMNQILQHGRVRRGWLGIAGQEVTPELAASFELKGEEGVLVSAVLENGPADLAGVRPGDILLLINSRTLSSPQDVLNIIAATTPGNEVTIKGVRDGRGFEIKVEVSERPQIEKER